MWKKIIGYILYCLILVITGLIAYATKDAGAVPYHLTDGSKQSGTFTFNGIIQDSANATYNFKGNLQASNVSNLHVTGPLTSDTIATFSFLSATNASVTGMLSANRLRVKTVTTDPGSTADFKSSTHDSSYSTTIGLRNLITESGVLSAAGDMLGFIGTGQPSFVKSGASGLVLTAKGIGVMPSWEYGVVDWTQPGTLGSTTPNTAIVTSLTANGNTYLGETHATTIQANAITVTNGYYGDIHSTTSAFNYIGTQQFTVSGSGQSANFQGSTHTTINSVGATITGNALINSMTIWGNALINSPLTVNGNTYLGDTHATAITASNGFYGYVTGTTGAYNYLSTQQLTVNGSGSSANFQGIVANSTSSTFIGSQQLSVYGTGQSANFQGSTHTTINTTGLTITGNELVNNMTIWGSALLNAPLTVNGISYFGETHATTIRSNAITSAQDYIGELHATTVQTTAGTLSYAYIGEMHATTVQTNAVTSSYEYVGELHATTIQANAVTSTSGYFGDIHGTTGTYNYLGTQQFTVSGSGQSANFQGSTHNTVNTAGLTVTGNAILQSTSSYVGQANFTGDIHSSAVAYFSNEPKLSGDIGMLRGMKNILINGFMGVAQRSTDMANPANQTYTLDRWYVGKANGAGTAPSVDVKQITSQTWSPGSKHTMELAITNVGVAGASRAWYIVQKVEDFYPYVGKTVTTSFRIKATSAITGDIVVYMSDGITETSQAITLSTGEQLVSYTKTLSSSASALVVGFSLLGTSSGSGATISGTGSIYITDFQLELGPVATSFERRPFNIELEACRRYYRVISGLMGTASSTTQVFFFYQHDMRTTPTISQTGPLTITDGVNTPVVQSASSIGLIGAPDRTDQITFQMGNFSGLTQYRPYGIYADTNANAIGLDAEIF